MVGPYTTVLRSSRDVLDTCTADGTLDMHLRFAHLAAAEWVMSGCTDTVDMDTVDAKGTLVRSHIVYSKDGGTLANSIVRERVQ